MNTVPKIVAASNMLLPSDRWIVSNNFRGSVLLSRGTASRLSVVIPFCSKAAIASSKKMEDSISPSRQSLPFPPHFLRVQFINLVFPEHELVHYELPAQGCEIFMEGFDEFIYFLLAVLSPLFQLRH
jgi:hypothetical protein